MRHAHHLDGIRGVAAFLVVIGHIESFWGVFTSGTTMYSQKSAWWYYYNKLCNGNFYVCIFFALSGMVLIKGYSVLQKKEVLQKAFVKRYFRLTPVVLSSVVLAWLFSITIGFHSVGMSELISHHWLGKQYTREIYFLDVIYNGIIGVYQGNSVFNGPLWTIGIEFAGSLTLFLFAYMFFDRNNFHGISIAFCILLIIIFQTKGLYISLFIAGANIIRYDIRIHILFLLPSIYLGMMHPWTKEMVWIKTMFPQMPVSPDIISHAIAALLFISAVQGSKFAINFFGIKLFRWLGRISFCMYVYHVPVIMSIGCATFIYMVNSGYGHYSGIIAMLMSFLCIFVFSECGSKYIDVPGQKLASVIAKKIIN